MTRHILNTLSASAGLLVLAAAQPSHAAEKMTCVVENTNPTDRASDSTVSNPTLFEVEDYSFDIEQTLNIGSATGGAGAGKTAFNPFTIGKKEDEASPALLSLAATGAVIPRLVCTVATVTPTTPNSPPHLRLTLTNATVTKFAVRQGRDQQREEYSFTFDAFEWR